MRLRVSLSSWSLWWASDSARWAERSACSALRSAACSFPISSSSFLCCVLGPGPVRNHPHNDISVGLGLYTIIADNKTLNSYTIRTTGIDNVTNLKNKQIIIKKDRVTMIYSCNSGEKPIRRLVCQYINLGQKLQDSLWPISDLHYFLAPPKCSCSVHMVPE